MKDTKVLVLSDGRMFVQRFTPFRRFEHFSVIVVFVVLVLTGFPQKFYESSFAAPVLALFGGLDTARVVHRVAGIAFCLQVALHLGGLIVGLGTGRMRPSLLPVPQDLRDAWANLAFCFGYLEHPPKFPKFDYRQKFEYVGILLGGMVMILSGLALLFPAQTASLLPGQVIPAARVTHSNEAMLALLVLMIWHVYGSHLSPEVFPMDRSIFTGYLTLDELRERHALEYERLFPEEAAAERQCGSTSLRATSSPAPPSSRPLGPQE